jgi:hypothetical protein
MALPTMLAFLYKIKNLFGKMKNGDPIEDVNSTGELSDVFQFYIDMCKNAGIDKIMK